MLGATELDIGRVLVTELACHVLTAGDHPASSAPSPLPPHRQGTMFSQPSPVGVQPRTVASGTRGRRVQLQFQRTVHVVLSPGHKALACAFSDGVPTGQQVGASSSKLHGPKDSSKLCWTLGWAGWTRRKANLFPCSPRAHCVVRMTLIFPWNFLKGLLSAARDLMFISEPCPTVSLEGD